MQKNSLFGFRRRGGHTSWPARTRRRTQLQIFRCRVLPLHRRTISGCSSGCNDFFRLVTDGSPCTLVPRVQDRLYSPRFQAAWFPENSGRASLKYAGRGKSCQQKHCPKKNPVLYSTYEFRIKAFQEIPKTPKALLTHTVAHTVDGQNPALPIIRNIP